LLRAPKGTKDILPNESYKWQYIEQKIRSVCELFGYSEIRTPVFEHTELFLRGVGNTTDIVQKEMYTFSDKANRSITLKPEGTAGVVRAFLENNIYADPQPTKLFYLNCPVFRYENTQAGRLREHHQFGVEVFGASSPSIDVEVIMLALKLFDKLGISGIALNINSIGCQECRPEYNAMLVEYFNEKRDELCKTCRERLDKNPLRILDCKEEKCMKLCENAPKLIEHLCKDCRNSFEEVKTRLSRFGVGYETNPNIVRGLDYYTKTVFEIISTGIGSQGTVCGGGRYDKLVAELDGPEMPGIGFGLGMERLLMVMENQGIEIPKRGGIQVFIATVSHDVKIFAQEICIKLRDTGIIAEIDHADRSLKSQLKYANKLNAKFVVIIGEDEIKAGQLKLKNMRTGEETTAIQSKIFEILENDI